MSHRGHVLADRDGESPPGWGSRGLLFPWCSWRAAGCLGRFAIVFLWCHGDWLVGLPRSLLLVAGVACKCWFPCSQGLRVHGETSEGSLPRSALSPALSLPLSLRFLQHLQSFKPNCGLPVPCCILPNRTESPKLIPFCLPSQGGHMLTSLPAATPMKPGSAVSTFLLPPEREGSPGSPLPLLCTLQCLGSPPCLLAVVPMADVPLLRRGPCHRE